MKKILFMILLMIPFFVYAECDSKVTISKLELDSKKGYAEELEPSTYECNNIKLNIKMHNKDDSIIYNLTIKNNSDDDVELSDNFNSESEYIVYKIEDSNLVVEKGKEKTFKLSATYTKLASPTLLVNGTLEDNQVMNLSITTKDENPNTSSTSIFIITVVLGISIITIILLITNKKHAPKYMSLLLIPVLVIPVVVYALTKFEIKLESKVVIAEPKERAIEPVDIAEYPDGKTKATVEVGDIVTIAGEEFYVIKHDGEDLVLLAHYNLKVGYEYETGSNVIKIYNSSTQGYGLQSSDVKGYLGSGTSKGVLAFAETNYWTNKVGEGLDYPESYCNLSTLEIGKDCAYVYDENSNLYEYVEAYKSYLEEKGETIKSARLLRIEEAVEVGCEPNGHSCSNSPAFLVETSYWLGSASSFQQVWLAFANMSISAQNYNVKERFGVRPVIVI